MIEKESSVLRGGTITWNRFLKDKKYRYCCEDIQQNINWIIDNKTELCIVRSEITTRNMSSKGEDRRNYCLKKY